MKVVDLYAGIGGFSAGAMAAGCTPVLGVDCDDTVLRLWAANTHGKGKCATLWRDAVDWPAPDPDIHLHLSPPCTFLSSARRSYTTADAMNHGLASIRAAVDFAVQRGYRSWSLEQVNVWQVRALLDACVEASPDKVAYTVVDAADHGVPSTRQRLIAGPPALIARLREVPVRRVSVRQAFEARGMHVPAPWIKNSTRGRDGAACPRSVEGAAHTQTASHPLTWCRADGSTVRCLTVEETATIQGFPSSWLLPRGSRAAICALGNAVCPPVAESIMRCANDTKNNSVRK